MSREKGWLGLIPDFSASGPPLRRYMADLLSAVTLDSVALDFGLD
jgi:hypothetical protein